MIKLWLKHKLTEVALNNLFNGLIPNFTSPNKQHKYKVGDKYNFMAVDIPMSNGNRHCIGYADLTIIGCREGFIQIQYRFIIGNNLVYTDGTIAPLLAKFPTNYTVEIDVNHIANCRSWSSYD